MQNSITRKNFLIGSMASVAASISLDAGAAGGTKKKNGNVDPNLSVFLSDAHINGKAKPTSVFIEYAVKTVAQILKMNPLPANVVVFGDLSEQSGQPADYVRAAEIFKPLEDAGIIVTHGMGNHDTRENFLAQFPSYEKSTLVPGRVVSKVCLGTADLVLLDSLNQKGRGIGFICEDQKAWLEENAPKWTRPTFIASHHPVRETHMKGASFAAVLCSAPNVVGFIHGHEHKWHPDWAYGKWGAQPIVHTLGVPSVSSFGDNGWVEVRTSAKGMKATLHQHDFCWLKPQPDGSKPAVWKDIIADHQNQSCTFSF